MRKLYLFAAAAVLLAACVKTQTLEVVTPTVDESAVNFDVYTSRATKAGKPQVITTDILKTGPGFGVFAYYTNNGKYDQYVTPNFMYNQQVKWETNKWVYEPVKYWPNETGEAAASDDKDYVSFFAYAPYVNSDPATGAVQVPEDVISLHHLDKDEIQQKNITGMINNTTIGDPKIKYVVDFNPATSVDLLWGVQSEGAGKDLPFLNQEKPTTTGATKFNMKHALVKFNVQIDALVDGNDEVADSTKIYVRSITFEGFATKGALNLNNTNKEPLWLDYAGINNLVAEPVTIFDGRKDGKEGYKDGDATREKVIGLNPVLVQSAPYGEPEVTDGVTKTPVNLFAPFTAGSAEDPIFVIPNGDPVKITIVYDVETQDPKLAGYLSDGVTHGSSIENTITKVIMDPLSTPQKMVMHPGYGIVFKLHLGMTSVKVDATVTGWDDKTPVEVDLPKNS